jgi:hypothetical protein
MSRKDYKLIAGAFWKAQERFYDRESGDQTLYTMVDMIIDELSDALKQDNINFDRYKFCMASKLHSHIPHPFFGALHPFLRSSRVS